MPKPLKCGLIGYGINAREHLLELKFHPKLRGRTEIVGIFDPNPEIQTLIQKKTKIPAVNSLDNLLNIPDINALIISSPPQFHANQAIIGLESNLHVFSEVPMALQEKDLQKIINAEDTSRGKYQFGENYIYFSEVLFASHLVESHQIGPTVYAEAEYIHDVTYRWRQNNHGDHSTPRRDSWYSLFDPLMYAHTVGPAQVALGGIHTPMPFTEVMSYTNDIGGYNGEPICAPSKAFQTALFQSESGAIAKCINAYIFAREPTRMGVQVVGRTGTYEAYQYGKPSRLFLADGHKITKQKHRKGKIKRIGRFQIRKIAPQGIHSFVSSEVRIFDDWLSAIEKNLQPQMHAKIAANMTIAGIKAVESAKIRKPVEIPNFLN